MRRNVERREGASVYLLSEVKLFEYITLNTIILLMDQLRLLSIYPKISPNLVMDTLKITFIYVIHSIHPSFIILVILKTFFSQLY